ncbi:hypothetical protein [Paraherbaspirillum soli]|uniref:Protein TonB n=1 Tax=Paraherbaspirillum soli TaxID=631222 RepID=A0ABW0M896_9BURK
MTPSTILQDKADTMTERSANPGIAQRTSDRHQPRRRTPAIVGALLTVAIHAIGIWYLLTQLPQDINLSPAGNQGQVTTITLTPQAASAPQQTKSAPPAKPKPQPRARSARSAPSKPSAIRKPVVAVAPETASAVQPDSAKNTPSLEEDFSAHVDAARRRRAAAEAQERSLQADETPAEEGQAPASNSIALANIAAQKRSMGMGPGETGGLFNLRHMGAHDAEFSFQGWSPDYSRRALQVIPVEQGSEDSIEMAVVNKMIEVIRKIKKRDFIFKSNRRDREFTLSARPEDTAELQRFLMREFFPDYAPQPRR